ncbi:MAG: hypothetical protein LBN05_04750 [Oscillospiraceae bacterium]|jgi:hypothetical protein|nr:hypothetical protein [Oscillospiraceae bacterium]
MSQTPLKRRFLAAALALALSLSLFTAGLFSALATQSVTITLSYQADDSGFIIAPQTLSVAPDLAEKYGYTDAFGGDAVSVLDAIVAAHIFVFGTDMADIQVALTVGASGWISNFMGDGAGNYTFFVDDASISVGAPDAELKNGETLRLQSIQDTFAYTDALTWFEIDGQKINAVSVKPSQVLNLTVAGIQYVIWGAGWGASEPMGIADAGIVPVTVTNGAGVFGAVRGALTDENGRTSVSFTEEGVYVLSAIDVDSDQEIPLMSPWLVVTVKNEIPTTLPLTTLPTTTQHNVTTAPTSAAQTTAPTTTAAQGGNTAAANALKKLLPYLVQTVPAPVYGNEWELLALARADYAMPGGYSAGYLGDVRETLADSDGVLARTTDYSRLILALTALGQDPTDVGGTDLLAALTKEPAKIGEQGIISIAYALLALDSAPYASDKTGLRKQLLQQITALELTGGGFSFNNGISSDVDVDTTAMVLQALAPYAKNTAGIRAVIDRALAALSAQQSANGGFASQWGDNPESIAQVLLALTALGIDPTSDTRFVKPGGNPLSALLSFQNADGGFAHERGGRSNAYASQQAAQALVAYDRFVKGANALFDMRDEPLAPPPPTTHALPTTAPSTKPVPGTTTTRPQTTKSTSANPVTQPTTTAAGDFTPPKTGDTSNAPLWFTLSAITLAGAFFLLRSKTAPAMNN